MDLMNRTLFIRSLQFVCGFALAGLSMGQEVAFSDYVQPPRATEMSHISMDGTPFYNVGVTAYSVGVSFSDAGGYIGKGVRMYNWPANGDSANNGTAGLGTPLYGNFSRQFETVDFDFWYKPETGAPSKFRIDVYNGTYWELGSPANGGLVVLNGTVGQYNHFRTRRINTASDGYGNIVKPGAIRMMAIQNSDNNYPGFGGTYNQSAGITFDEVRVSMPRRLNGMYLVRGTTNKDLGSVTFNNVGGLKQYNNWIRNLGNVDIVNVYGTTSFGNLTTTGFSSNLMQTYLDSGGTRQFNLFRPTTDLNGSGTNSWIGAGAVGDGATDKFFGLFGLDYPPNSAVVLRQVVNGGSFNHYIRTLDNNNGYAAETQISLGGEDVVAVADVNGDAMDDIITRKNNVLYVRLWTGKTNSWPFVVPTFAAPTVLTNNGYLKVIAVGDINDDGIDDLLLSDAASGDVFTLMNYPSGTVLKWVFQLNASQHEKIYALADADNDGLPEIYSTRQRPGDNAGEIDIRKMSSTGNAMLSIGSAGTFNYSLYTPCAIGDINGDGSADVAMIKSDAPYYSIVTFLVDPVNRAALRAPQWICNANTPLVRPIYSYGSNF
ncbi:MAG: hypothetical protein GC165_18385 [Armatimonadetes bacterium]|nr:hypothetical protein [Armatimonadota bacterium]